MDIVIYARQNILPALAAIFALVLAYNLIAGSGIQGAKVDLGLLVAMLALIAVMYRRGRPALRVSSEYLEGKFGRIAWTDVSGIEKQWGFNGRTDGFRRIAISLQPDATIS